MTRDEQDLRRITAELRAFSKLFNSSVHRLMNEAADAIEELGDLSDPREPYVAYVATGDACLEYRGETQEEADRKARAVANKAPGWEVF
jgi:hypothetical protein